MENNLLISHLKDLKKERTELANILQSDLDNTYVYYIAPLYNIKLIMSAGGIYSRNNVKNKSDFIDLSSHKIQVKRSKKYPILCDEKYNDFYIHDCVNLFLNPLNYTYFQYRRNSLLYLPEDEYKSQFNPLGLQLCILEINLDKLLYDKNTCWAISEKNIAIKDSVLTSDYELYSKFQWQKIFSIGRKRDNNNKEDNAYRSAELIICNNCYKEIIIHTNKINRIILFVDNIEDIQKYLCKSNLKITFVREDERFSVFDDPFRYEKKFILNIFHAKLSSDILVECLNKLSSFIEQIGYSILNIYDNKVIAMGSNHGILHTIRVMLWVLMLSEINNARNLAKIEKSDVETALVAALFHDACRGHDQVDYEHGEKVVAKLKENPNPILQIILPENLERFFTAIRYHCKVEEPDYQDNIYKLIKDADAIDRGRFGPPNKEGGCKLDKLKLDMFKNYKNDPSKITECCCWIGYWLAKITAYVNLSQNPIISIRNILLKGLVTLSNDKSLEKKYRDLALELKTALEKIKHDKNIKYTLDDIENIEDDTLEYEDYESILNDDYWTELRELTEELDELRENFARSEEEGWFYPD